VPFRPSRYKLLWATLILIRDTFSSRQYTVPRIADETSLTQWHFAIVMIEKGKRFYTLSSCRVIIKSWIILQFTALVELINVSSRSRAMRGHFSFSLFLFRSLSLSPSIATVLSGEFETRNKKFKSRRLLSARGIAACKNDPGTRPSNFYEVIYKLCITLVRS